MRAADDYLTKPFGADELLARIRVALRRAARRIDSTEPAVFETGSLKVDLAARLVLVENVEVHLTPLEYRLLIVLVRHAGKVLTHRFFIERSLGDRCSTSHTICAFLMAALRRKLEHDPAQPRFLLTEQGVGYRLAVE